MATIGVDTAATDENGNPSWTTAQAQGHLRFVGLRACNGVTPDSAYPTYRRQLDALAIPNFPYLALVAGLDTPELQVDSALQATGTLNQRYFPLAIDVEGSRNGLSAELWLEWVIRAYRTVKDAIGVAPMLYTSRTYWVDPAGMNNLPAPELSDCLPWVKYYPWPVHTPAVYDPVVVDKLADPPVPPPWGNAFGIEQYMGDAPSFPGFRSWVDMDRLHVVKQGDHNDTVVWIQKHLPGLVVDGIFGPATTFAVRSFQAQKKLTVDGIVGLDTFSCLSWVVI